MGLTATALWIQFQLCGFREPTAPESGPVGYAFGEAPNMGPLLVRSDAILAAVGLRGIGQTCTLLILPSGDFYVRGSLFAVSCRIDGDLPHCQQ